ncbi:MAG: M20/M25/M40 family metallo-hydrolase [Actinobacteria bacterium]|nr:MAG: M20/M25/M40 family metallo-hydrolase [Actinomycetota bacterium]
MSDERLLRTFLELVRIDSPSGREAGVRDYCAAELRGLGFTVTEDGTGAAVGGDSGNLVCVLPATAPGSAIALCAHMDCVPPCACVEPAVSADGVVRSGGDTVLGADDKGGIAAVLEAVRRVVESGRPHAEVRVLLTVGEEVGLRGAKQLARDAVEGAAAAFVFDADGEVGGIVTASPTHYTFVAQFHGRASHAGVAPEKGRSALLMASRAVAAMQLGRLDERTTANVGTIEGGRATNVVPESVTMTGECRSLDEERVEAVREVMDAAMRDAARSEGGSVDVHWTREYRGQSLAEDSPAVVMARAACERAGVEPRCYATGGGSDANVIAALGVPTLVLASGMRDVHGTSEWIAVRELERCCALAEAFMALACEGGGAA